MNGKIQVDSTVIKILYYKYRDYLFPTIIFIVSWVIFYQFILPQFQTFFAEKDQISASEQTLAVMSQNYNTVVSFSDSSLKQSLNIANSALPSTKDFVGILSAISNAAGIAGVTVNDYSFNIGDLNSTPTLSGSEQTITIDFTLNGTLDQSKQFITALSNQLPLSQVTSFSLQGENAVAITADFYYNPLPKFIINPTSPLPILNASQKKILEQLYSNSTGSVETASSSGSIKNIITKPKISTQSAVSSTSAL